MNFRIPAARLALAVSIALSASALALAGEATDTTEIEVVNDGVSEKVQLEQLRIGETRQVYSEAGTLVTVTRLADSIELDIGGDKTSVPMVEPGALSHEEILAIAGEAGADGKQRRVIRMHHGKNGEHAGLDGQRRVIVIEGDDMHALDGDGPHVVVDKSGEGKQVIVKRRVLKDDAK